MDESQMLRLLKLKYEEFEEEEKCLQGRIKYLQSELKDLQELMKPYREILEYNNVLLDDGPDNKWCRIWLEKWGQGLQSS